jgi:hypothetical protein
LALVELFRECADTDLGILFETRDCDGLVFRTRTSLYNQDSCLTLDANLHALDAPFEPISDDQRLRNDINVVRVDGSSYRVTDTTSVAAEGQYDTEDTVNTEDDQHLPHQAGWRLHLGTWPGMRYPAVATGLVSAGTFVVNQWLGCDLGDKLVVNNLMAQIDQTVEQLIEGYEETLSFYRWDVSIVGSPAGPWEVGVRDDADRGRRDTAGTVLLNPIDSTTGSIPWVVTLGPSWTTDAGDYPFDLNVGGEHVRAGGYLFFGGDIFINCVRSLNGVVKSHAAGTPVRLWRPTVRAL